MFGAVYFELRATGSGPVPRATGRLMHGVFFKLLQSINEDLATAVHDGSSQKPFTVSKLTLSPKRTKGSHYLIKEGDRAGWRVTALNEPLLRLLVNLPPGTGLNIGGVPFELERAIANSDLRRDVGIINEDELMAACLSETELRTITFRFLSPTTFRLDKDDYAFPYPPLIFGSLAAKWHQYAPDYPLPVADIKEAAGKVVPLEWNGSAQPVYFGQDRGTVAFTGQFTFDLHALPLEYRQLFLLLAQFAVFAGTGRLTAQGFGRTEICYC